MTLACLLKPLCPPEGVKNMFQTKDMEFVNVSLPWMPDRSAMVPQLVEKQLKTEKVTLDGLLFSPLLLSQLEF